MPIEGARSEVRPLSIAASPADPGWNASTFGLSNYEELPAKAREYIAFLEARTGVEVGCISTGPERNQTIVRPGSRFEKLVG